MARGNIFLLINAHSACEPLLPSDALGVKVLQNPV
jgi:hypothetical protein